MSHMVTLSLAFGREDLLRQALAEFDCVMRGPGLVRYWGGSAQHADRVVGLSRYDLGFVARQAEKTAGDVNELSVDAPEVLVPMYDAYNGEVEKKFGRKLSDLSAKYYEFMMQESAASAGFMAQTAMTREDSGKEIVLQLEVA